MTKAPRASAASAILAALAAALLASCPAGPTTTSIPYSSKVIDFYPYVAADTNGDGIATAQEAVPAGSAKFTLVYDTGGTLSGRFDMTYDADGNLTRTDCRQYGDDGTTTVVSYDTYTYDTVSYYGQTIYRLRRGETFSPGAGGDTSVAYYTIDYALDSGSRPTDHYSRMNNFKFDDAAAVMRATEYQVCSWADLNGDGYLDGDADQGPTDYLTEQYFKYDDTGANPTLTSEYAAYYNGVGALINELYHVVRAPGSTVQVLPSGADEGYFYVQYSNNPQGYSCLQSDNWYGDPQNTPKRLPTDLGANTPCFVVPLAYAINPRFIGDNADMIMTEYDSNGNIIKDSYYTYGSLQETKVYRWLDASRIADKSRYVDGGTSLEQRETYRYYDLSVDGTVYAAREKTVYYMSADPTKQSSYAAGAAASTSGFSPVVRDSSLLLSAYHDAIFQSKRDINEHH